MAKSLKIGDEVTIPSHLMPGNSTYPQPAQRTKITEIFEHKGALAYGVTVQNSPEHMQRFGAGETDAIWVYAEDVK